MKIVAGIKNFIRELVLPKAEKYRGIMLPSKRFRFCGTNFKDNEYYLNSAHQEAERLQRDFGLCEKSRMLDVGCGVGRIAIGIKSKFGAIDKYVGIDVDKKSVRWCKKYIPENEHFQFVKVDVLNTRYNPEGEKLGNSFRFPIHDTFDVIYLYSVFSHMNPEDIVVYLNEFKRLLKKDGKIFLTAFVEDNVPDITHNPDNYNRQWKGSLHCIRFSSSFFNKMISDAGFKTVKFVYADATDGQSTFYLMHQ